MGHFFFTSFVALILLYLLVLFSIFPRECIFGFITFSLFHFIFLYFFSVLSLLFLFYISGSFVLVQVKQVRGFY